MLGLKAVKEGAAREAAWRYHFKRKWIREELFARRYAAPPCIAHVTLRQEC